MQEKIHYSDVMALGFTEEIVEDNGYYQQYGFKYTIISLNLTKKISIDWSKETQLAEMIRVDGKRNMNIIKTRPIENLKHLKEIVDFFLGEKDKPKDKDEEFYHTNCC